MFNTERTIKVTEKAAALMESAKKLTASMLAKTGLDFGDLDDGDALMIRDCYKLMDDAYDFAELQAKQMDQINHRLEDIMTYLKEHNK